LVEIFVSVCLVLLLCLQMLLRLFNKLDSVAMKDTDLPKPHHWSLQMDGLDQELRNYVA
jgi:hypothetical protein